MRMASLCGSFTFGSGIWYSVTMPVFGIELADQRGVVAGEPDVAVLVLDQAMRPGVRRLQRIFPDRAGLRIDAAKLVGELPGPPDRAVLGRERIVRARAERRHVPQLDRGLHRARR